MSVRHWQILCGVLTIGLTAEVIFSYLTVKHMVKDHNNLVELGSFLLTILDDRDVHLDEFEAMVVEYHLREQKP